MGRKKNKNKKPWNIKRVPNYSIRRYNSIKRQIKSLQSGHNQMTDQTR